MRFLVRPVCNEERALRTQVRKNLLKYTKELSNGSYYELKLLCLTYNGVVVSRLEIDPLITSTRLRLKLKRQILRLRQLLSLHSSNLDRGLLESGKCHGAAFPSR
jgi:hypothetical protein